MIEYQVVFIRGIPHLVRTDVNGEIVKGIEDRELNRGVMR